MDAIGADHFHMFLDAWCSHDITSKGDVSRTREMNFGCIAALEASGISRKPLGCAV
jgi:hypothetical protein